MKKIKHTKKIQNRLSIFLVLCLLLSFIPTIHGSSSTSTLHSSGIVSSQQGGSSNCYDGVCFEGEVEGNTLISYQQMISQTGIGGSDTSIDQNVINQYEGAKEINRLYQEELSKGGIYLKFTDNKYKDSKGKSRTFYVSKKPLRKEVSYDMLYNKGLIYGWDIINPDGTVKPDMGVSNTYKPFIKEINGTKYIARLLRGRSNYGAHIVNYDTRPKNSEWNRTILPITKGYRFGDYTFNNNYAEQALRDGDTTSYYKRSYKVQSAQYNWFGDLTLGAWEKFNYNNKDLNSVGSNGQGNWTQEFYSSSSRAFRGNGSVDGGAASFDYRNSGYTDTSFGWRLVLEPLIENKVKVKQTIKLKKFDPDKKPLAGVKFILNGDEYTTNSNGEVEIPVWKYPAGNLILEEPEQTVNGIKYTAKKIPINKKESCYDGMCFEGEVEGNNLITYQKMLDTFNSKSGQSKKLIQNVSESTHKEIHDQYAQELSKGGMYLKFTDNKYKDSKGKPRTFYVSKKPATNEISYDMLYKAGMVYGQDLTPEEKSKIEDTTQKPYTPTIVADSSGQKYIVRLLRGRSNYGAGIRYKTGETNYNWTDAKNSEWNRSIVAITKQYRGESNSMEQALKDGNSSTKWVDNNYKNQTASYNWFGDLTLGTWSDTFKYNNKDLNGVNGKGQYNWTQEFDDSSYRAIRGYSYVDYGAALSGSYSSGGTSAYNGWRLVLEPLTTNN